MTVAASEPPTAGRLENWKRKLLDLTLRNRLLNYQATKREIPLVCPDLSALAELLGEGKKISFAAAIDEQQSGSNSKDLLGAASKKFAAKDAQENLQNGKLTALLDYADMDARLIGLFRMARSQLQEGGTNTLHIALGYLEWHRPEDKEHTYLAPLLLLPVTLHRTSVRAGIKLTNAQEAPLLNPTLMQMLRQDFRMEISGLSEDDLPEGSAGIDVAKIFRLVKRAVRPQGFKVVDKVVLSTFSFVKYLMWKDLADREELLKENTIVRHLIETPVKQFKSDMDFVEETKLDDDFHANDLLTPFSSDSSQLACIASADKGKSFVLQGPPGTGKSQTIGNLIAHLMGKGNKVLFVSEKMAALNVVHKRLSSIGLGKFCLELHSNKASKQAVLNQLREAHSLHTEARRKDSDRDSTGERLMQVRKRLNTYVQSLHKKRPPGISIYEALGFAVRDGSSEPLELAWQDISEHGELDVDRIRGIALNLADRLGDVRDLLDTPLTCIENAEWSFEWESGMMEAADAVLAASDCCKKAAQRAAALLGYEAAPSGMRELALLQSVVGILPKVQDENLGGHFNAIAGIDLQALTQGLELLQEHGNLVSQMSSTYSNEEIAKLTEGQSSRRLPISEGYVWPFTVIIQWARRNQDRQLLQHRNVPDVDQELSLIARTHDVLEQLRSIETTLQSFSFWQGLDSDAGVLSSLVKMERDFRSCVGKFADRSDLVESMRNGLATALDEHVPAAGGGKTHLEELSDFAAACEDLKSSLSKFAALARSASASELSAAPDVFAAAETAGAAIRKHQSRLHEWCFWQHARIEAAELGMEKPLVRIIGDGNVTPEDFADKITKSYYRWWLKATMDKEREFRLFAPKRHEDMISKYRTLDESFGRDTAEHIAIEISNHSFAEVSYVGGTGSTVLDREFQKKRRHLPVRQLMSKCGGVVSRLTPCFLMSPLSVAQYLPLDFGRFDVVIFDEASQIPVWDAVGAIARGKQVIVAGDYKQMPPTTFFDRSETEPDIDDEYVEELESILEEMLAASIPSKNLRWHYRSRHESLIAFSNHKYYNNDLITFPSAVTADKAVQCIFVGGTYDRGKSRTNKEEAVKVVEDVLARLRSAHAAGVEPSIGVITFNSQQQNLIEDMLDKAWDDEPELEKYIREGEISEPVFVKNLETVQGDERDVCIFSTAYGPDLTGHMRMNFGPLNLLGGQRRLNVAVTRAREALSIYTSIKPEMIDISKVSHAGVKDLRDYLLYARDGLRALAAADVGSTGGFESDFEREVARMLTARGWTLRTQVGVSRYRIDLGVVHPHKPGDFMCGVECDGATYHSAPTARDRDKLREQALGNLGWKLVRVWSTAFFRDPDRAIDKVHSELELLLEEESKS